MDEIANKVALAIRAAPRILRRWRECAALDVGEAFEIPSGFPTRFKISGAYADTPSPLAVAEVGKPATLELKPFEVLVLEFAPAR